MKVYVLFKNELNEGSYMVDIFATQRLAENYIENNPIENTDNFSYYIIECKVKTYE